MPQMEGFADRESIKNYVHKNGSFYLGKIHKDHGLRGDAGIDDDRHIFICAGSRAGKGTSLLIPNLIRWQGGVFCIDPKGEAASVTAMRRGTKKAALNTGTGVRKFIGQQVAILDPFNTVRGAATAYKVNYDPLSDIDITHPDAVGMIETIAEGIVVTEAGKNDHWSESAATILAGVIEAVKITKSKKDHTLPYCRTLLLSGFDKVEKLLEKAPHGDLAPSALDILQDVGEDERGSFKTTLSRQLKWLNDRRIREHLSGDTNFSLMKAIREQWTIYVCIPPRMISRFKRWLRLLVNFAFDAKMSSPFDHKGQQSLFILDEFAALGHFPIIEDAAAYMAGYGIKLVPVIQNLGQIRKHYGANWETFLGNSGAIIGWGLNDKETENYFSDRLGAVMIWREGLNQSQSGKTDALTPSQKSSGISYSLQEQKIRWPSEIHEQGSRKTRRAFVVPADTSGFTIERQDYFNDPEPLYDSLEAISEWEKQNAKYTATTS